MIKTTGNHSVNIRNGDNMSNSNNSDVNTNTASNIRADTNNGGSNSKENTVST